MSRAFVVVIFVAASFCCDVVQSEEEERRLSGVDSEGDSLKIDDLFWTKLNGGERSENGHRSIQSADFNANTGQDEKKKVSLSEFLEALAKKQQKKTNHDDGHEGHRTKDKTKSTSWDLMDLQRHHHPYDERNGWVSLEPVPWSMSKISKWQSKYRPSSERPWDESGPISTQRPYLEDEDFEFNRPVSITPPSPYLYNRPTESSDRYDDNYYGRPRPTPVPTIRPRPTAYFGHKIQVQAHFPSDPYTNTGRPYHNNKDCHHPNHPYEGIITDGQPSNFPPQNPPYYDNFRRRGSEFEAHSENSPLNGEGEWVLLSTTKGYKPRKNRQRALAEGGAPTSVIRASRGVRLTVLPPLKGSNVNMTTSHGGLLQVESTFESVEEAKKKFDKNALKNKEKKKKRKPKNESSQRVSSSQLGDPSAVMAAVGAGMIPATMAMMVPIAMTG